MSCWTKGKLLRKDDIKILGFSISAGLLKPQQEELDKIDITLRKLKMPKELLTLLASFNYYRCFSSRFSYVVAALYRLMNKEKANP